MPLAREAVATQSLQQRGVRIVGLCSQLYFRLATWSAAAVMCQPVVVANEDAEPRDITPTAQQLETVTARVKSDFESITAQLQRLGERHKTVNTVMHLKSFNDELSVDDGRELVDLMLRGEQMLEDTLDAVKHVRALEDALRSVTDENAVVILTLARKTHERLMSRLGRLLSKLKQNMEAMELKVGIEGGRELPAPTGSGSAGPTDRPRTSTAMSDGSLYRQECARRFRRFFVLRSNSVRETGFAVRLKAHAPVLVFHHVLTGRGA